MYQETAYFSLDYETEVESLADPEKMAKMSKIVQFEHTGTVSILFTPVDLGGKETKLNFSTIIILS